MSTPTNPERLWVLELGHGERAACLTEEEAAVYETHVEDEDRVRPAEYVLASVAAAEKEAAVVQMHVDATNGSDAVWHAQLRKVVEDRDALRRERDALLSGEFVQKVAAEREAFRAALEKVVGLLRPAKVWEPWEAMETAEAALAAAKGVG